MKNISFFIFTLCTILFSCKKAELPVPKHDAGNVTTSTVNMDASYKWQIYFDLKTNSVVGQNLKTAWDLGFENGAAGFHVVLNTAKFMFAYNTGDTNFSAIVDTIGFALNKKWDSPSGSLDTTAIGNWQGLNNVYIIDRGYNETGVHQGFIKIQIQAVDATSYIVRFAQLNGTGDITLVINKNDNYNFTFLSFSTSSTLLIEPPKDTWDLVFTQYTHIFYDPTEPYLVTGCLSNRYNTMASVDSVNSFTQIKFENISNYTLSNHINIIGYDWKTYTGGTYVTDPNTNYVIKDSEGFFYKLHFIDFYNQSGIKGNPKWEFQKL